MNTLVKKKFKRKHNDIVHSYHQLVKHVSESSGYTEYEVKDVLSHFTWCLSQLIKQQDKPVEVRGLGRFVCSYWPARTMTSNLTGRTVELPDRLSVSFTPSTQLKNFLNGNYEEEI